MRTYLVCLLVVSLLGCAFAEAGIEKRFVKSTLKNAWTKIKKLGNKAIDTYKDSDLHQKVKDVARTGVTVVQAKVATYLIKEALKKSINEVKDALDK